MLIKLLMSVMSFPRSEHVNHVRTGPKGIYINYIISVLWSIKWSCYFMVNYIYFNDLCFSTSVVSNRWSARSFKSCSLSYIDSRIKQLFIYLIKSGANKLRGRLMDSKEIEWTQRRYMIFFEQHFSPRIQAQITLIYLT